MKGLLTSTPVLKIVDTNEYFVVCTDACQEEIGGVLMQNGHVICYESKNLKNVRKSMLRVIWNLLLLCMH